jgi:hypothetical protein
MRFEEQNKELYARCLLGYSVVLDKDHIHHFRKRKLRNLVSTLIFASADKAIAADCARATGSWIDHFLLPGYHSSKSVVASGLVGQDLKFPPSHIFREIGKRCSQAKRRGFNRRRVE